MSFGKVFWVAVIVIATILGIFFYNYYCGIWSSIDPIERNSVTQIYFGTAMLIGVVFALLYSTVQFVRSRAKPDLKIGIDKDMKTKDSFQIPKTVFEEGHGCEQSLDLYIHNTGNVVADLYNVEFTVRSIFNPVLDIKTHEYGYEGESGTSDGESTTIPFYSRRLDEFVCYVRKPICIGTLRLRITPAMKDKNIKHVKIGYRIFGSWADKQEGALDITLNEY